MRRLLTSPDIPFGTQYYRAPSPQPTQWERDLRSIARLGMNTVKFWVQWRWNNPREGAYMFDDIDRLMDIAQKNGLRVMLNTIFDVAPAWIYRKYPDAAMSPTPRHGAVSTSKLLSIKRRAIGLPCGFTTSG